jgi:hypothetical protein
MRAFIKYIFLAVIILLSLTADFGEDPPERKKNSKNDTIVSDTSVIQMEQLVLQEETKNRRSIWDSLLIQQDSLIKRK